MWKQESNKYKGNYRYQYYSSFKVFPKKTFLNEIQEIINGLGEWYLVSILYNY